jgi:hypothetical protein
MALMSTPKYLSKVVKDGTYMLIVRKHYTVVEATNIYAVRFKTKSF